MQVLRILTYMGSVILFINTVAYFTGFNQKGKASKYFALYLLATLLIQVIMEICAAGNINNHFLSTYYLFSQFIFLSYFFYYLCGNSSKRVGLAIKYLSMLITAGLALQYTFHPSLYFNFNSVGFLVTTSILVIYSVVYLYKLLSKSLPFHYTTIGIFIYLISTSVIFAAASSIVQFSDAIGLFLWKINAGMFIIYQLLILYEWKQTYFLKAMDGRS